jgi:hypothetical protein
MVTATHPYVRCVHPGPSNSPHMTAPDAIRRSYLPPVKQNVFDPAYTGFRARRLSLTEGKCFQDVRRHAGLETALSAGNY